MRAWWREISGLVNQAVCGGCGTPRTQLCEVCGQALLGRTARRARPVPEPAGLPVVHAAAAYTDSVRAVILAHKERGALGLARPLGAALAEAVRAAAGYAHGPDGPVLLVPVPSAPSAVRARGHDAARRIALAAAAELRRRGRTAGVLPVLRQRRRMADQAGLTARERLANVAGALEVRSGGARLLAGATAVIVDDLMTTGATLVEAARAVSAATGVDPLTAVLPRAAVVAVPPLSLGPNRN
ncbi:ComF family protein [Streptomyces pristinaespiralis]|nr:ComF family protein [Streptomyces pristinaespiralis]